MTEEKKKPARKPRAKKPVAKAEAKPEPKAAKPEPKPETNHSIESLFKAGYAYRSARQLTALAYSELLKQHNEFFAQKVSAKEKALAKKHLDNLPKP